MSAVAEIYRRIVYQEQSHQFIDAEGNLRLQPQVFPSPENSYSQIMQRLAVDAPRLFEAISHADLSPHARRNLDRFLSSAATNSERYGAVLHSPAAVERALTIFEFSNYLTDILVRYPTDVAFLDEINTHPDPEATALFDVPLKPERRQSLIRLWITFLRAASTGGTPWFCCASNFAMLLFVSGARDLYYRRSVFDILEENTTAADRALQLALAIADPPLWVCGDGAGQAG